MDYRREIDGLRALAVLPVILFHAGFQTFSGGFVGVDVFFVISGYLITSIILNELQKDRFSLLYFYERRARRILPALFLVMAASSFFAYSWMLPDELKNFGQSIVATTLFSNNILLAFTSGYWALASEFKPLLHTWSLGVEEQYYILFPFLLMLGWRFFRKHLVSVISVTAFLSLVVAGWGVFNQPDITFYLLPTRAWEILLGSLVAFYLNRRQDINGNCKKDQFLSICGGAFIVAPIFIFDQNQPSPGFYTLVPTLGAALIILFASERTLVGSLLSSRVMVGLGLVSYSAYLWHQPLFAFARIYSIEPPSKTIITILFLLTFVLAYLTWRFIETPCRNKSRVSRNVIFFSASIMSIALVLFGYYFHKSYGIPSRIYEATVATAEDMDKKIYNQRVFRLKMDRFSDENKLKILVIGNSFGRDFVNMTTETFDLRNIDVVYRDDLIECIVPFKSDIAEHLYGSADIIVFASGRVQKSCINNDIAFAQERKKNIFYIGTKHFGYNLNWLIRLNDKDLPNQFNPLLVETIEQERELSALVPVENYISLLSPIIKNDYVPITDGIGRLISADRAHLTRYGAIFFGEKVLLHSHYGEILNQRKGYSN